MSLVIALCLFFLSGIFVAVLYARQDRMLAADLGRADCIMVLGCALRGDVPSPMLERRLGRGLELYRAGISTDIIVCGGQGDDENRTEAAAMAEYYINHGVPAEDVHREDASANTWENMENAKAIMAEKGFSNAVIVSSEFHLPRIQSFARQMELTAQYAGSKTQPHLRLYYTARECASFAKNLVWH